MPTLKNLVVDENTPKRHLIVYNIFQDANNMMKNGTKLRQMINALNEVELLDEIVARLGCIDIDGDDE